MSSAHALGLGEMNLQSGLGEPFRAEVALRLEDSEAVDGGCFKLVPRPQGADDLPWLAAARLELKRGARPHLRLSTSEPVAHPILMVGIRVACGFELAREYTLLLEPVAVSSPVAAAPRPESAPAESRPARRSAAAAETWQVVEGETLGSIAAALHPRSRSAQRRFVAAAVRANPELFPDPEQAAQQTLAQGTSIAIPAARPAPLRVAAESATPLPVKPRGSPRRDATAPAQAALRSEDRLSIGGASDTESEGESGLKFASSLDLGRVGKVSETRRELLRQEQRLLAALEDRIVEQLTLSDKIQRLEQTLASLNRGLEDLDRKLPAESAVVSAVAPEAPKAEAPEPAKAAPVRQVPAETSAPVRWRDGILLALLGAAVLGLLLFLRLRTRRRAAATEVEVADAESDREPQRPQLSEVDFPLEADTPLPPPRLPPQREALRPMPAPAIPEEHAIDVAEHESALELAEIMLSFGRVQGAAQTLADYIEANPRQAVRPWLKLLEVYRNAGMRAEFDTLARRMNQTFNVAIPGWDNDVRHRPAECLEDYPRAMAQIEATWSSPEALDTLHHLLRDNRSGTRMGFPMPVLHDLMLLIGVIEEREQMYSEPQRAR